MALRPLQALRRAPTLLLPPYHDGAHADGERHVGHFGDVVVEEAGVGNNGVVG